MSKGCSAIKREGESCPKNNNCKYPECLKERDLEYICDDKRHLICIPYSIENLHRMAEELGIKRNWFHKKEMLSHYDMPKGRIREIKAKCRIVSSKRLVQIIRVSKDIKLELLIQNRDKVLAQADEDYDNFDSVHYHDYERFQEVIRQTEIKFNQELERL